MVTVTSVCFTSAKTTETTFNADRVPCLFPSKLTRLYIKRYQKPSCLGSLKKQTLEILRTQPPKLMGTKKSWAITHSWKTPLLGKDLKSHQFWGSNILSHLEGKTIVSIIYIYSNNATYSNILWCNDISTLYWVECHPLDKPTNPLRGLMLNSWLLGSTVFHVMVFR